MIDLIRKLGKSLNYPRSSFQMGDKMEIRLKLASW